MLTNSVSTIRDEFARLLQEKQFTSVDREGSMTSLVGNTTIEIMNTSFLADEQLIFGKVNQKYVEREEQWYNSMSLNVNDIPGGPPEIWRAVADKDGFINSNYGWCIYSAENGKQYEQCLKELKKNPASRRGIMIYTRPSMWTDYNKNGRSDFCCTNAVTYLIRNGALHANVQMRSSDSTKGYANDRAWALHVLENLASDLGVAVGGIFWNATSLHVYSYQYYLVDHYGKTGETNITKAAYAQLYPDSPFLPQETN